MSRQPFTLRRIRLLGPEQVARALDAIRAAPLDPAKPLEFILREEVKERKLTQQGLMWVGPLKDIAEQIIVDGRKYSDKVWHKRFKELYLPEEYDPELCISEDYLKWEFDQSGEAVLVGSTTDLTVRGFSIYLENVHAFGGNMGVMFHEAPRK